MINKPEHEPPGDRQDVPELPRNIPWPPWSPWFLQQVPLNPPHPLHPNRTCHRCQHTRTGTRPRAQSIRRDDLRGYRDAGPCDRLRQPGVSHVAMTRAQPAPASSQAYAVVAPGVRLACPKQRIRLVARNPGAIRRNGTVLDIGSMLEPRSVSDVTDARLGSGARPHSPRRRCTQHLELEVTLEDVV